MCREEGRLYVGKGMCGIEGEVRLCVGKRGGV